MRALISLTVLLLLVMAAAIRFLDAERLSAAGSILSGVGSLLAVIWFSAGLRYQSHQLDEQRKQFSAQFLFLKESSRRDALLLVQGILERAEEKAIIAMGSINSLSELPGKYMDMVELKTILESDDPYEVMKACASWLKREGAAMMLLQGIKSAAGIYLKSINAADIDYSKPADEFYFIYSPRFSNEPFFNTVSATAFILSEVMFRYSPARDAAIIAHFAAAAKSIDPSVVKLEKLRSDIQKHVAAGYPLPKIANDI